MMLYHDDVIYHDDVNAPATLIDKICVPCHWYPSIIYMLNMSLCRGEG